MRQVAQGVLHCAMLKKSIKLLPQLLQKVESSSTFCNACGNNKIARQVAVSVWRNLRHNKLHEKLSRVISSLPEQVFV